MNNILRYITLLFLVIPMTESVAQTEEMIRVNVYQDTVRVYHNKIQPVGHGFNIYREGVKLNLQPVTGVVYPEEMQAVLGDRYPVLSGMMNTASAQETFIKLRANRFIGRLAAFLFPAVAESLGQVYVDTDAPIGNSVFYKIEFVDDNGEPTGEYLEKEVWLTPLQITPPDGLSASNEGNLVTLSWKYPGSSRNEDDQVIQFNAYRVNEIGNDEVLNDEIIVRNSAVNSFSIVFNASSTGTEERYYVKAVDIAGHESAASDILEYRIVDNVPPQQVSGLTAISEGNSVSLSWNPNIESDLAGYHVYRSDQMNKSYTRINEKLLKAAQTSFTDVNLKPGKNYSYKIAAEDKSGNLGVQSLAAMARIRDNQPPETVNNLTVIYNGEQMEVSWSPLDDQNSFRSYVLLRRRIGSGNRSFTRLNAEDLRKTAYLDWGTAGKGFLEGAMYEYAVLAMDSASNFSDTTRMMVQIPDLTPPAPPKNVSARNHDGIRVDVGWDASESADVVSYQVYRSEPMSDDPNRVIETDKRSRQVRDNNIILGRSYFYMVVAVDSLGNKSEYALSDTIRVKDSSPPHQVRNVMLSATDGGLTISWEPVNAFDLDGYRIYQSKIATGEYILVQQITKEATQHILKPSATGHWYRIRAIDTSGNESKPSEPKQHKNYPE